MSTLEKFRTPELDLEDRIRWLAQDADNLVMAHATHGKNISPQLVDNIIKIANNIKLNLEILQ